jgi:hypothetical protein
MRSITRRTVLRGLGTAMALPFLEAMIPTRAFGVTTPAAAAAKAAIGPKRVAWVYVPNGITMEQWTPAEVGPNYTATRILQPISAFRDRTLVITGMVCDKANANGDGPGDHARANAAYLTGAQPKKNQGSSIKVGVSIDQAIAQKVGHLTKFPSLEIGYEEGKQVGSCDSGYACAYNANLSWRNENTPVVKDCNPQSVFDRLFNNGVPGESAEAKAKRLARRKSVLDFVQDDAKSLQAQIGSSDKRKVDEYLTSIREIEVRMNRTEPETTIPEGAVRPEAGSREFPVHVKLMIDLMVLAFQGDLTRVITFPFANELSAQKYPWCGADVTHHGTSHHMHDPKKIELITKINVFHMEQFAYMLGKLDAVKEGNGSLLDNLLISYGSGTSDGDRHNHDNLPLLLVGKGGGTVATGQHVRLNKVPINNLWTAMAERVDVHLDKFGDATGSQKLA